MDQLGLLQVENPIVNNRFRQLFIGAQLAAICGILNLTFFGNNLMDSGNPLFFRMDFVAYIVGVIITSSLFIFLDQGQYLKAMTNFLSLWSVVMAFATWFGGGLASPLTLSFPVLLVFAALFTELIAFLSICTFLTSAVIFMGFNHIYGWYLPPKGMEIQGISSMISAVVLITLSGYVCWVVGRLLKTSFEDLRQENKRVLESQATIKKLADCDALTGLLNRNGAEYAYQHVLGQLDFSQEQLVAYFIDLDNFKSINDLFDHEAGDQLLMTMSARLMSQLEGDNFACRFGGDEFVLVARVEHGFDIEGLAAKLIGVLAERHSILGTEAEITASIGMAVANNGQTSFSSLCKKADMAMYKAKQSGKNSYHQYSDELKHEHMRSLHVLDRLKSALGSKLLDLYFQPKINLKTNEIEGAEALLRWNRGNSDSIGPEEFIPIIESTELIHSIGTWVINEACIVCKQWHATGSYIRVAVNVSALQLTRSGFYHAVADALQRSGLPPEFLEIEITEHSLLQEMPLVSKQLEALKTLGVNLAIDDFGTGYSNMGYLTRLQVDVLKLDRSFISQLGQSEEHRVVIIAVIKMAKVLGMKVVAEGIETESEKSALLAMGCDMGQGYLWSRALPDSEFLSFIQHARKED
ncbi:MAG: putative bifunctional diguanylate cyclase/phosphodiesterase [Leucothrix sp.]